MAIIILLLLAFIIYALVMPVVANAKASDALSQMERLNGRLTRLEKQWAAGLAPQPAGPQVEGYTAHAPAPPAPVNLPTPRPAPPPVPVPAADPPFDIPRPAAVAVSTVPALAPPVAAAKFPLPPKPADVRPVFTLEQFMGMKLFAWIGGLALFIGVVLFVKYAFDHNLIPPAGRVAIGFATGLAVGGTGVWLRKREAYRVLSHTLCATGVLTLYGVSFAGHALYELYGSIPTFVLMSAVTAAAFISAVRMNAIVIAALGILGGFLTPILVSTGRDQPLALFTYIALLDLGVLLCVQQRGWKWITAGAAFGTGLMQAGWLVRFFAESGYAMGMRPLIPATVLLAFPLLFLAAGWRRKSPEALSGGAALSLLALLLSFGALAEPALTSRPWMLFGFIFLTQLTAAAAAWKELRLLPAVVVSGGLVFLLLGAWSVHSMTPATMPWALGLYLVFGLMQTALPVIWHRRAGEAKPDTLSQWLPLSVLALITIAVVRAPASAMWMWPGMVAVNAGVFFMAAAVRRPAPAIAATAATMLTLCAWLTAIVADAELRHSQAPAFLVLLTVFTLLLTAGGAWLRRKVRMGEEMDASALLLLVPAVLPFLLLIVAMLVLPGIHVWGVAGVSLLLCAVLLTAAAIIRNGPLCLLGLVGLILVQTLWRTSVSPTGYTPLVLTWHSAGWALFLAWPFLFRGRFAAASEAWTASALAGVVECFALYHAVRHTWPAVPPGLLPAAAAVPLLAAFALSWRQPLADAHVQRTRLALYGGVALLFLTAIIPVQWQRQWITLGFALEGAALCWLRRRVDHDGLRVTGLALLAAAFVRLTFNAAAYTYYPRTALPFLNWQLYTYGTVIIALLAASRFLRPMPELEGSKPVRIALGSMAGLLGFLLLNLEIADFFTPRGSPYIQWQFRGDFAASMTFTIAWALYALGLVIGGFVLRAAPVRYTGIGLMVLALAKLFLHDLAEIGSLYRIAALIVVALIALVMSWLYQRFAARLK